VSLAPHDEGRTLAAIKIAREAGATRKFPDGIFSLPLYPNPTVDHPQNHQGDGPTA
jgi:hypothetical protein